MVHAQNWPTRKSRREARVEAILDTALSLLITDGLEAFTIRGLAQALGCALGAIYRYFPSKEALIAALERRVLAVLGETLIAEAAHVEAAAGQTPRKIVALAHLLAAARRYQRLPVELPEIAHLLGLLLGDPRVLISDAEAGRVLEAAMPVLGGIAMRFAEAEEAGALAPGEPGDRAVLMWGALQGVSQLRKLARIEPQALSPERLGPALVDTLLLGWGAARAELELAHSFVVQMETP